MSTNGELRQMAGEAMDRALQAHHLLPRGSDAMNSPVELALTSLAMSFAFLVADQIREDDERTAEKAASAGLCWEHKDDVAYPGICRVEGCTERAPR